LEQAEKDSSGDGGDCVPDAAAAGKQAGGAAHSSATTAAGGAGGVAVASEVPYRCIIQGRKEMPLVQLLLKNHAKGDAGDYVTFKDRQGFSLGEK
jgi:hypothetical protein